MKVSINVVRIGKMGNGKKLQGNNDNKADIESPKYSSRDLLDKEKQQMVRKNISISNNIQDHSIFNFSKCWEYNEETQYSTFQNVESIMKKLHALLFPNKEHIKVFTNVPVWILECKEPDGLLG